MALTDLIDLLAARDVTDDTCDLMSSATMVVLLKNTQEEMEALRQKQGLEYKQPQRPLGMGINISKIATNCVLEKVHPTIGVFADAHQFTLNAKGGCDMVQWILQIIMEAEHDMATGLNWMLATPLGIWNDRASERHWKPT